MNFFTSTPAWWAAARAQGLVSEADCAPPEADEPSVLVIALAMLGALVCAALLVGFLLLGFDLLRLLEKSAGASALGVMAIACALFMLKSTLQIFSLCLALVLLGAGQGLLLISWMGWLVEHGLLYLALAAAVVAGVQVLAASMTAALWIRKILGCVCGVALYTTLLALMGARMLLMSLHPAAVILALGWGCWVLCELRLAKYPRALGWAAFVDAAALGLVGVVVTSLVGVVGVVGVVMMGLGGSMAWLTRGAVWGGQWGWWLWSCVPPLLTLAALAGLLWRWHKAGQLSAELCALLVLAGLGLAVFAWFSAPVAVLALIAAAAVVGARWRIVALCALGALWLLGQFCYWTGWPLAYKGLGLAVLGAGLLLGLGLVHGLMRRRVDKAAAVEHGEVHGAALGVVAGMGHDSPLSQRRILAGLLLGAALVFGLVNWDVARKESVIANGQPVLVPLVSLAPADPRSIMQGDYMSLRFSLPSEVTVALESHLVATAKVVARLDGQGIAQVLRLSTPKEALGEGEILLPIKRLKGWWVLAFDAYFFPEGQGERFKQARFGDFRVLPDGRALLVGLADAQGQPILVEMKK